jgi:exopolysaccharide biosynthesis WecB/TagA/CpsF family protein/anti-anti-sigma factor
MKLSEPKTVVLLGVPFQDVTMDETLATIDEMVQLRVPRYIATANLDFAAQASRDVELQQILLDAHLVLCDGTPLIWASRWLQAPLRERVAGSDLTPRLVENAAHRGYRLFFLGSDAAVLQEAKTRLEARYPGVQICGLYAPPYASLLDLDNVEIASLVRAARPDILLVALGAPKQEKWIYMHYRNLGVPCSIGVGASLDFIAGKVTRAPRWTHGLGLEWAYRLWQEPRRLFGRYLFDATFLVRALYRQKRALQAHPAPAGEVSPEIVRRPKGTTIYSWAGRVDAAAVASGELADLVALEGQEMVLLDASEVTFIDSTGLGTLLKSFREARAAGGGLVLLRPSPAVRNMVRAMKLERLLPIVEDEQQARALLATEHPQQQPDPEFAAARDGGCLVCRWSGDLDIVKAKDFSQLVQTQWLENTSAQLLQIDLADVRFMDSSGLGSLLQARKLASSRLGARFEVIRAGDNVRNVIRLAKLGELLGVAQA